MAPRQKFILMNLIDIILLLYVLQFDDKQQIMNGVHKMFIDSCHKIYL